ncbi:hypothetical protein ACIRBX_33985 [Kitasatospora sp. NPDC096147]|uniref:hypothetical protein n=1 Tax=Kitasatospora sp. NPDC096147 TaxID=3364093 RepID=UPI00380C7033
MDPAVYDRALAEPALPGTLDMTAPASAPLATAPARPAAPDDPSAPQHPVTNAPLGVRLCVPGAHLFATSQLGEVTEALTHTVAARGIACVYGDAGQGKTVAVHQVLGLLPRRVSVRRAPVIEFQAHDGGGLRMHLTHQLDVLGDTNRHDPGELQILDITAVHLTLQTRSSG